MRFSIIVPILLISQFCLAQIDTTVTDNKICIKINPLAFIDFYGGCSYRLGAEFKLIHNTAFSFEAGKYYDFGPREINTLKIHPDGFIIRPEIKCYLNKYRVTTGTYVSLEFLYKKINFDYKDSFDLPSMPVYEKQYSIWKEIYAISGKYGLLVVHKNKLVLEVFAGGGVRFIKGHNSLSPEEDKNVLSGEGHGDMIGYGQRQISGIWPNIIGGFKIGYSVKRKVLKPGKG